MNAMVTAPKRFRRCPASLRRDLTEMAVDLQDPQLALYAANLTADWAVSTPERPYNGLLWLGYVAEHLGKLAHERGDGMITLTEQLSARRDDPSTMPDPTCVMGTTRGGVDIARLLCRVWREMDREMRGAFAFNPRGAK